jgi:hypothetical protein
VAIQVAEVEPGELGPGRVLAVGRAGAGRDVRGERLEGPVDLLDHALAEALVAPAPPVGAADLVANPVLQHFEAVGLVGHGDRVA